MEDLEISSSQKQRLGIPLPFSSARKLPSWWQRTSATRVTP